MDYFIRGNKNRFSIGINVYEFNSRRKSRVKKNVKVRKRNKERNTFSSALIKIVIFLPTGHSC